MFRLMAFFLGIAPFLSFGDQTQPAQTSPPPVRRALPQITQDFVSVDAPAVVLQHVRVIDGTGAAAIPDQDVVIERGMITLIGPSATTSAPAGARVLDLAGRSIMP